MGKRTLDIRLDEDLFLLPIFGGDSEDGDEDPDDDDDDDGDQPPKPKDRRRDRNSSRKNAPGKNREDDDDDDDLDDITDPAQRRIAELSREARRHRREKNAAKREKEQLEQELNALKNQGKDENETRENELKSLKDENTSLKKQLEKAVVRTAIGNIDHMKWHDLDDVYSKLDLEDLEVDFETGDVDGLESQLKSLAKRKPYLLKESNGSNGKLVGKTGHNPPGGGRNKSRATSEAAQREELLSKYSSLQEFNPL